MTEKTPELTEEEKKIIFQIRTIGFGKVVVSVKNEKPLSVETQKTIPLSEHCLQAVRPELSEEPKSKNSGVMSLLLGFIFF